MAEGMRSQGYAQQYRDGGWRKQPSEGPKFTDWLLDLEHYGVRSILDLGCGDAGWIGKQPGVTSGRISYFGVDLVPTLIEHNKRIYPWFSGEAKDIEGFLRIDADLVILRHVLEAYCNGVSEMALKAINAGTWKYFIVSTSAKVKNGRRRNLGLKATMGYNVEASDLIGGDVVRRFKCGDGETLIYRR